MPLEQLLTQQPIVSACRYLLDESEEDWSCDNDATLTAGRNF